MIPVSTLNQKFENLCPKLLLPGTEAWSAEDLRVLSNLIVSAMVATAEALLTAGRAELERQIAETARTQLRMVLIGAVNWRSETLQTP